MTSVVFGDNKAIVDTLSEAFPEVPVIGGTAADNGLSGGMGGRF